MTEVHNRLFLLDADVDAKHVSGPNLQHGKLVVPHAVVLPGWVAETTRDPATIGCLEFWKRCQTPPTLPGRYLPESVALRFV